MAFIVYKHNQLSHTTIATAAAAAAAVVAVVVY
jgi:hypothetical protein